MSTTDKARNLGDLLDLVEALGNARKAAELVGYHPMACKIDEALDFAAESAGAVLVGSSPTPHEFGAAVVHRGRSYYLDHRYRNPRVASIPVLYADEVPLDRAEAEAGR